jgi:hypothetical protein
VDVWAYLEDRRRECRELSVTDNDEHPLTIADEAGSKGQRGRLMGRVSLSERAVVSVHESVVVRGEGIHREKYAYFLSIDGREIGGYERDPSHAPPEHQHCSTRAPHERSTATSISFKDAIEEAWEHVSRLGAGG